MYQQQHFASLAAAWEAAGRDPGFLCRGTQLAQLEIWTSSTDLALTQQEAAYLQASISARETERLQDAARLARETALRHRAHYARVCVDVPSALIAWLAGVWLLERALGIRLIS